MGHSFPLAAQFNKERRNSNRYLVEQALAYRSLSKDGPELSGSGVTINISSRGLLFKAEAPIPLGRVLRVAVIWPDPADGPPLQLVMEGKVVRCHGQEVALAVQKKEFRTRKRTEGQETPPPSLS